MKPIPSISPWLCISSSIHKHTKKRIFKNVTRKNICWKHEALWNGFLSRGFIFLPAICFHPKDMHRIWNLYAVWVHLGWCVCVRAIMCPFLPIVTIVNLCTNSSDWSQRKQKSNVNRFEWKCILPEHMQLAGKERERVINYQENFFLSSI